MQPGRGQRASSDGEADTGDRAGMHKREIAKTMKRKIEKTTHPQKITAVRTITAPKIRIVKTSPIVVYAFAASVLNVSPQKMQY